MLKHELVGQRRDRLAATTGGVERQSLAKFKRAALSRGAANNRE